MNTEVVYGIFKRYVSDGEGAELPEKFEDLPERDRQNIEGLYKEFILAWVDNEFKTALLDEELVRKAAAKLVMAFKLHNLGAVESLRYSMGDFVLQLVNRPCIDMAEQISKEVKDAVKEAMENFSSE